MLKKFTAQNYRNLDIEDLEFTRVNVFIGPNNAGKSNLIDAMALCADLVSGEASDGAFLDLLKRRGWSDLLNRAVSPPGTITLRWTLNTPESRLEAQDLRYELRFEVGSPDQIPQGFYISEENLGFEKPRDGKPRPFQFFTCHQPKPGYGRFAYRDKAGHKILTQQIKVEPTETVLRQLVSLVESPTFRDKVFPLYRQVTEAVREQFRGFRQYSSAALDLRAACAEQPIDTAETVMDPSGASFVNVLANLEDKHGFLKTYTEHLRELVPELQGVRVRMAGDRHRQVEVEVAGRRFKMRELSDGTKQLMLWTLLLHTPEPPPMLALDEPAPNAHVAWLQVLGRWLQSATKAQIFVSTHSPDLLDSFTDLFSRGEIGIFVFDPRKQKQVARLPPENVREQLEQGWQLGDLYRIGEPKVGGWPF